MSMVGGAFKSIPPKVWLILGGGALTIYAWKNIKSSLDRKRYEEAIDKFGENSKEGKALKFADIIYGALFPSGQVYIIDGTNEGVLYSTALDAYRAKISFGQLAVAYRTLFKRELQRDLQNDLSSTERRRFQQYLENGKPLLGGIRQKAKLRSKRLKSTQPEYFL
ncbi:hypothetical protein [Aureibacter tunicatorum]|uniref:Uncharacterized protein n=1 Tax=Aureibacter tunicatorum TaxID=866807 RepID=A0AAE4BUN1_9BACT|nr:hypothetical protein [Aureibacter tunicatorum]MDR6240972.1 hypothetical protein [Aureibacter tunicatorum]